MDDLDTVLVNRLRRLDTDLKKAIEEACEGGFSENKIAGLTKKLQRILDTCMPGTMKVDIEMDRGGLPVVRIMPSSVDPVHARNIAKRIRSSRKK